MEGARLIGEISTDWEGFEPSEPVVSDRLEAFTAAVAEEGDEPVIGDAEQ